jgi:hypothetical protein
VIVLAVFASAAGLRNSVDGSDAAWSDDLDLGDELPDEGFAPGGCAVVDDLSAARLGARELFAR